MELVVDNQVFTLDNKAKLTFLGSGTSQGVPMIGCKCDVCTSQDPRDKRLRASVLVEYCGLTILVDAGPDFRYQMLRQGIDHLDAIILTHNHKDHTGGLDDVRSLNYIEGRPINIYCEPYVEQSLRGEYPYAFTEKKYPGAPEWHIHHIGNHPFTIVSNANEERIKWVSGKGYEHIKPVELVPEKTVDIIPIQGYHDAFGKLSVLGFRFGNIAYITDMKMIPDEEFEKLKGLDYVTMNCVKNGVHHSHFGLDDAIAVCQRIGAKQAYLTHISHLLPKYEDFVQILPEGISVAYDGLVLE